MPFVWELLFAKKILEIKDFLLYTFIDRINNKIDNNNKIKT